MKDLWIIRHAKSSWAEPGQADFDRPLNPRGLRDGARMQAHLATLPNPPRWLWCSTAQRAQATATFVRAGFAVDPDHCITTAELYHASAETILDVLQRTPEDVHSVAVVAHNPGLTDLVNRLGSGPVTDNLPTFGIAHFQCDRLNGDHFRNLVFGGAKLKDLIAPKDLRG